MLTGFSLSCYTKKDNTSLKTTFNLNITIHNLSQKSWGSPIYEKSKLGEVWETYFLIIEKIDIFFLFYNPVIKTGRIGILIRSLNGPGVSILGPIPPQRKKKYNREQSKYEILGPSLFQSPPWRIKIAMTCLRIILRVESQTVGNIPLALL